MSDTQLGGADEEAFESFLHPTRRSIATHELASRGADAIPMLESLFTGEARNAFGRSYREIGALECGLVTARLLGPLAKPLENHLRSALRVNPRYASAALGALGTLDDESIVELTRCVAAVDAPNCDISAVLEAAAALCRCNARNHARVAVVAASSSGARWALDQASKSADRGPDGPTAHT